jgi:hypothetical protein
LEKYKMEVGVEMDPGGSILVDDKISYLIISNIHVKRLTQKTDEHILLSVSFTACHISE